MRSQDIHPSQLLPGEQLFEVRLPDGREVVVLAKKGQELFTAPGRPANFGGVAGDLLPHCHYFFDQLDPTTQVQIGLNIETGKASVDVVHGRKGHAHELDLRQTGGRPFQLESLSAA